MSTQSILITGASSGFGLLITRTLLDQGHTVVATMRDLAGRNAPVAQELSDFAADSAGTLHTAELDVTSAASIAAAFDAAREACGHIDVVVNNAGIGCGGLAETFATEQYQRIFDINVFGVQRVMRAVLPAMRERGSGLVINISSVMGRIVIPFSAPYTATKYALEGLTESYRYELMGTGIDCVIIEPGGFMTGFGERMLRPSDSDRIESYGARAEIPEKMWGGFMEALSADGAPDPQEVADAVAEVIATPAGQRPLRVVVDPLMGGEAPRSINQTTDQIQAQLLANLGLGDAAEEASS
jgi:NAD(P)-dependent dehydrogenase (short-subunit alcohol dehydrogenase family)